MDQIDDKMHVPEGDSASETQLGSEPELATDKVPGQKTMSSIHEAFFIITICMAQILALAGLGQGFGE